VVLSNSNTYTGGTRVSAGTLQITGATQATTSITFDSGGVLGLTLGSHVTAASAAVNLTGGAVRVTGTPASPSHTLLIALSITGTPALASPVPGYQLEVAGNELRLVESPVVTNGYPEWSDGTAFDADTNGDGVTNGIAWVLGAAGPDIVASGLLPTMDNHSDANYFIFTYRRTDEANLDSDTTITVQYGTSLTTWTKATHDGDDIIIIPTNDFYGTDPGIDKVQVKIKKSLATGGKLFARLHAEHP
jgi:autotransporter-associated beta strand protein